MRFIKILCFAFVLLPNFIFGQTKLELLFIEDPNMEGQRLFIKEKNIAVYQIFYQQFFTTNEKFDEKKLKKQIELKFPNPNDHGFGVLDWEGKAMDAFKKPGSKDFKYYLQEFIKSLRYAKKLRPNVKWGFYHLPYIPYWDNIKTGGARNYALEPLLKEQDFIAPSLYTFFPNKASLKNNAKYLETNMRISLEIGVKYNIPVYPFIWQRTHPSNKKAGYTLLDETYFKQTVEEIAKANYKGVYAKGIFWWHSESYSYRTKDKNAVINNEYKGVRNVQLYQKKMFEKYYNSIKAFLKY